jgi:inorganic phosphate transporter, PiT family
VWVAAGADAVKLGAVFNKVILPAILAPLVAGIIGLIATFLAYRITVRAANRTVTKGFKFGQIVSRPWWRSRTAPTKRRRRWGSSP